MLEFLPPKLAAITLFTSSEFRVGFYLANSVLSLLLYQGTNATTLYLIGITMYLRGQFMGGNSLSSKS